MFEGRVPDTSNGDSKVVALIPADSRPRRTSVITKPMKQFFNQVLGRVRSWRLEEVLQKLDQILEGQKTIMNSFADVQAGITKLGTDITTELAAIQAKLTVPAGDVVAQADLDAAVAALGSLSSSVEAETAALSTATGTVAAAAPTA